MIMSASSRFLQGFPSKKRKEKIFDFPFRAVRVMNDGFILRDIWKRPRGCLEEGGISCLDTLSGCWHLRQLLRPGGTTAVTD